MKGQSGIYKIQSKVHPERCYIGSAVNITTRWNRHLRELSKNIHHSYRLQNHVNKYGIDDLLFSIIEPCFIEWLINREQYYFNTLKPYFNICKVAGSALGVKRRPDSIKKTADAHRGKKFTEEHRRKLSESKKGKVGNRIGSHVSEETKQKLREFNLGKKLLKETIEKRTAKIIGQKRSPLTKQKMKEAWRLRKPISQETKEKISNSSKGRKLSPETIIKMANSKRGIPRSLETRQKISFAKKGIRTSVMTAEGKLRLAMAHKGVKFSEERKNKISLALRGNKNQNWALRHIKKQIKEKEVTICN